MAARVNTVLRYIPANIRALRLEQGLTQESLAEASGLTPRYIQTLEGDRANPRVGVLIAVAHALSVEPARLFEKTPPSKRRAGRPRGS